MKARIVAVAVIVALATMAMAPAPMARESTPVRERVTQRVNNSLRGTVPFAVSDEYTGRVGGEMMLGGGLYLVLPSANVYELGNGAVAQGLNVIRRHVFATGIRINGLNFIYSLVLRPADEDEAIGDAELSASVSVRPTGPE